MDIKLSSVQTLFADGTGCVQSGSATIINNSRPHPGAVSNSRQPGGYEVLRTYNNRRSSPEGLVNSSRPDFNRLFGEKTRTFAQTDNLAEIHPVSAAGRRAKTHLQDRRDTKARNQIAPSLDIATLVLPARQWRVAAQEQTKASATSGAGSHTILARHEQLQPVQFLKLSKNCQPTGNTRSTGPESLPTRDCPNFQSKNAKPSVQPAPCQGEPASTGPAGVMTAATGRVGFSPPTGHGGASPTLHYLGLAYSKAVDTEQKPDARPKKSQQSAEKTGEHKSRSLQGLTKSIGSQSQVLDPRSSTLVGHRTASIQDQHSTESRGRPAADPVVVRSKPQALPLAGSEVAGHHVSTAINNPRDMGQLSRAAAPEGGSHVTTSISQQITGSVEASLRQGNTQLTIHLNPPELGRVSVKFQQQQDQISILLEVSKPETRREIELTLPAIMRSLQDCGVQISRLEVQSPNELAQQADKGQLANNSEMPQHHSSAFGEPQSGVPSGGPDHDPDQVGVHKWLTSTAKDRYPDDLTPQMVCTFGSINVLM